MISLEIPVEKIPYVRTIEGRKFKAGKWEFPDSALPKLQQYGLVSSDIKVEEKEIVQYELSPYLRKYQKEIVNTALNAGCYGIKKKVAQIDMNTNIVLNIFNSVEEASKAIGLKRYANISACCGFQDHPDKYKRPVLSVKGFKWCYATEEMKIGDVI